MLAPERLPAGEELPFARAVARHFHEDGADESLQPWLPVLRTAANWVVRDGDAIVGNTSTYQLDLSVPGGARVPVAGVSAVGVSQTHRRRGLLTAMLREALDHAAARGDVAALLYASESAIYGRYGFGAAAPTVGHRIDRAAGFRDPVDPRLVVAATPEAARAEWPRTFDRLRDRRGGVTGRNEPLWDTTLLADPPAWRGGATPRRLVHVPGRGYAAYRVAGGPEELVPAGEVRVEELVALDPEAEAALWQHVCDIDLTVRTVAPQRPPDDVLPDLLTDPLRAHTSVTAPLYARLLDVPAAFEARTYGRDGDLVVEVVDATRDQGGAYRFSVERGRAEVRRVAAPADLTLPVDALGAAWLGGVRVTQLVAARRGDEHTPGAAAALTAILATARAPWTPFEF